MADKVYMKYTSSDYSDSLGKNASGIEFHQTAPSVRRCRKMTINSSRDRQRICAYPELVENTDTAMFH
ncbi:hypothetical protein CRI67_15555 [Escherichia sp. E4702]|nr:hypothetical protein CRI67_15555 [Escherichia sp. E4702]